MHGRQGHPAVNALRLCLGTMTVLPVRPPSAVDRRVAGVAMLLAPLAGALLAVVAGAALWLIAPVAPPLLAASLTVGLLALLTRGMHLDGLADTADGLGSRRAAAESLAVMRRSDIGPFGVVTLVVALLVQVAAVASLASFGSREAVGALALALVTSRTVLPLLCLRGIPAARPEGLGHQVAGTVSRAAAAVSVAIVALLLSVADLLGSTSGGSTYAWFETPAVMVLALVAGATYGWHCSRRLGGVTGDVLGASVEVTFTVALVILAFR